MEPTKSTPRDSHSSPLDNKIPKKTMKITLSLDNLVYFLFSLSLSYEIEGNYWSTRMN